MTAFTTPFTARFSDVDPAGIVYFARLIDFFHRALEVYFEERLLLPYAEMVMRDRVGVPVVHIEGDFMVRVAFGERFFVQVSPHKLGGSSLTVAYEIIKGEQRCARFLITHVTTDMDSFRPVKIPANLRAALTRDLEPSLG